MPPDDASTIEDVIAATRQRPRGGALMVVGNFNTDLVAPEGQEQDGEIVEVIAEEGLEDMSDHFLTRHKLWLKDGRTWAMYRGGREVRSQTN